MLFNELQEKLGSGNFTYLSSKMIKLNGKRWSRTYIGRILTGKKDLRRAPVELLDELVRVSGVSEVEIRWYLEVYLAKNYEPTGDNL